MPQESNWTPEQGDALAHILTWPIHTLDRCLGTDYWIVIFLAAGLTFSLILISIIWIIKRTFFPEAKKVSIFAIASPLLGVLLGFLGTVVTRQFEPMYQPFGMDNIPEPTLFLLKYGHLLWVPLIFIIPLRRLLQTSRSMIWLAIFSGEAVLFSMALMLLYSPFFPFGICA
jgi:hypothetical protein